MSDNKTWVRSYHARGKYSDFDESDPWGVDGPPVGEEVNIDGQDWIVMSRALYKGLDDEYVIEVIVRCMGCYDHPVPGVRWPTAAGGDEDHNWVERCDYCETYDSDALAAIAVAQQMGGNIGIAMACGTRETPYVDLEEKKEATSAPK